MLDPNFIFTTLRLVSPDSKLITTFFWSFDLHSVVISAKYSKLTMIISHSFNSISKLLIFRIRSCDEMGTKKFRKTYILKKLKRNVGLSYWNDKRIYCFCELISAWKLLFFMVFQINQYSTQLHSWVKSNLTLICLSFIHFV